MQEALLQFLEEEDETVVQPGFERIATALSRFVEYLNDNGVADASSLKLERVEEFLHAAAPAGRLAPQDASDIWYSIRRFLKWLKRKKYSGVYDGFSREQTRLRGEFKSCLDGSPRDGSQRFMKGRM